MTWNESGTAIKCPDCGTETHVGQVVKEGHKRIVRCRKCAGGRE